MNTIYLLLGSNMGNSKQQLLTAIDNIQSEIGAIIHKSSLYSTQAWGNTNQPDFLNQVVVVTTNFMALETLNIILKIETKMGRIRTIKNAPRVIDIDILFFNSDVISLDNLSVPHPEIENRRFVLIPLNELVPDLQHPVSKSSMHTLLLNCTDALEVKKLL